MEAHDEVTAKEKEKTEGANLLAPPDHDYVVLEAKELMKYFTEEGKPTNELQEVRASSRKCLQRPQKSADDYKSFLSENSLHYTFIKSFLGTEYLGLHVH